MPYKIQFVGLVCFLRQNGSRIALLPDGRSSDPPHEGRIVVDPKRIISITNWPTRPLVQRQLGEFMLPPCSISISGVDQVGPLDTSNHERRLNGLQALQPAFRIELDKAETIATLEIRQGMLQAFRYPRTPDIPQASVISELAVEHDDNITITVTPRDDSDERTIVVMPGTEIAIANDTKEDEASIDHFHIYEKLDANNPHPPLGGTPDNPHIFIPVSQSTHRIFDGTVEDDLQCPNTGCCP